MRKEFLEHLTNIFTEICKQGNFTEVLRIYELQDKVIGFNFFENRFFLSKMRSVYIRTEIDADAK